MKSLLVDVLRQAKEDAPAEDEAPALPQAAEVRQDRDSSSEPTPEELNLMETGQYAAAVDPVDEPMHPADPIEPVAEKAEEIVAPEAPGASSPLASTSILNAKGACLSDQPPLAIRIAQLSPVICILAVAGVASGYLLFNSVSGGSLNDDLDEISEIVSENSRRNWLDEPVADTDVFDRAPVAENMPASRYTRPRQSSAVVHNGAAPSRPVERNATSTSQSIEITVSSVGDAAVRDPAYRLVSDAYAHYQNGRYADAEQKYLSALKIEPNHREALLGVAGVYQQTGRRNEAVQAYEQLLAVDPGDTVAASAVLSLRSSEPGWDSESELKHLLQRFPAADHLHFSLASVFVSEKRWAEARRAFENAYTLAPHNPSYNYNLAVSCEQLGDIRCARRHYESALDNAEGFSSLDRNAVLQHIDRLSAALQEPR